MMRALFSSAVLLTVLCATSPCFAQWFGWGGQRAGAAGVQRLCDAQRAELPSPDDLDDFIDKLRDGEVKPAEWQGCATALLVRMPPPLAAEFIDRMGKTYRKLLRRHELDQDTAQQEQLHTLQQIYLHRPTGASGTQEVMNGLLSDLGRALQANKLGPFAMRYGRELLATIDLERGQWQGAPVNAAALDRIYEQKNATLLQHFAQRLPDPGLRKEARRRIVRLRLAAIPYPELLSRSAEVEEAVLTQGVYPLPLAQFPPMRGALDAQHLVLDAAVLRQDLNAQTVAVFVHTPSAAQNFLADIVLRGALQIWVQGLAQPVTVCGPGGVDSLDPMPCIAPQDLRSANELGLVGPDGVLHLLSKLPMKDALALAAPSSALSFTLLAGNTPVYTARWGIHFESPRSFILQPVRAGQMGPNLDIQVDNSNPARLVYQIADGRGTYAAVLERDSPPLRIASQGGGGQRGPSGYPGNPGQHGRSGRVAHCPSKSGEDGENGGDGGDGGPGVNAGNGGDGGDVRVRVLCGGKPCENLVAQLRSSILSLPGPGGEGGPGGGGGPGGSGGSGGGGTSCGDNNRYSLQPGRQGQYGRPGMDGQPGQPGRDGAPGRVAFQVVP